MTLPTPPPIPTPATAPSGGRRPAHTALLTFAVLLLGVLAFRCYGDRAAARPTESVPSTAAHRVDLNAADRSELLQVPGLGPHLADAIMTHRRDRGRFAAVDELEGVKGVGGKTLEKLRPWVTVADPAPERTERSAEPAVERLERKPPAKAVSFVPTGRAGKVQPGDPPIDVNTASADELIRLPGVGPVTAQKIIDARGRQPFRAVDELRRVKGIGVKTLEAVRPFVVAR